jgi:anti-sigma regulatory factor (Ser/Thr protein kinase)
MTTASSTAADDRGAPSLPSSYAVTVKRTFPGSPDQVARVREFVRLLLGPLPVVDEAVLLASELATNAVIHTASGQGGAFDVAVSRYPSAIRIEVHDAGSHQVPMPRPWDHLTEEGRGLGLVSLIADSWGHSEDTDGRSVLFELCWQPPIEGR